MNFVVDEWQRAVAGCILVPLSVMAYFGRVLSVGGVTIIKSIKSLFVTTTAEHPTLMPLLQC
jgi:hypothetical protein